MGSRGDSGGDRDSSNRGRHSGETNAEESENSAHAANSGAMKDDRSSKSEATESVDDRDGVAVEGVVRVRRHAEFREVGLRVDDGLVAVRGPRAVPEDLVRERRRDREHKHRVRSRRCEERGEL